MSEWGHALQPPARRSGAPDLAAKVQHLRGLLGPGDEAIETHFAWVFLAGDRAWKLRKPVRRDTMDYSTVEARRRDSEAEVRLNRRLAHDVYLGTQALKQDAYGRLSIGGDGEVVDWLVEMRRLDRNRMLDVLLAQGTATRDGLRPVIELMASFYSAAPREMTETGAFEARLRGQVAANAQVLDVLDGQAAAAIRDTQLAFVAGNGFLLGSRAVSGCVVEAHGDLRPEHILPGPPPAVIDCLEFDRNLRILDRAEELCFLELECTRLGRGEFGRWIAAECLARLGDAAPESLLAFYRGHRAATRAKLYVWRADEPDGESPETWYAQAREYLATALAESRRALT